MNARRELLLCAMLCLSACHTGMVPPPSNVASAPRLEAVVLAKDSIISAAAEAAETANGAQVESNAKKATSGAIGVVRAYSGPATDKDRAFFLGMVNNQLTGKLADSDIKWANLRAEADVKNSEIASLKKQVDQERVQAANDLARKLKEAQDKASVERKKWIMFVTIGLGGFGLAAGVVMLVLGSQYAFLGPRAAFSAIGAGLALIATGIAVNAVEQALDRHPWVIWSGLIATGLLAVTSCTLIYGNHKSAKT